MEQSITLKSLGTIYPSLWSLLKFI